MRQITLQRHPVSFYIGVAAVSLPAGMLVARSPQGAVTLLMALMALGGLALLLTIPAQTLFLGWLFLAPFFQEAAEHSSSPIGEPLTLGLYAVPAAILAVHTIVGRCRDVRLTAVDFLPAAYLAYVIFAVVSTSQALQSTPKFVFTTVVLGPVVYYFLRSGPGARIPLEKLVLTLMYAAQIQGVLGVVNFVTGWNPWGDTSWQEGAHADFPRAVATLSNPGVLGMVLGVGIVSSVAVLSWDGPRSLRRPAFLTLATCIPGLLATMTRAPILATIAAVMLVLVFGRWRVASFIGIVTFVLVAVALLPTIRQTELYQGRVANTQNVSARAAIQDWSLRLAAEKPVLGWGVGSFDEAKNAAGLDVQGLNIAFVLEYTSHNTYLTLLVELGGLGLLLFALPFVLLGGRGLSRVRARTPERWLLVTALASLLLIVLTASTFDLRFFSFVQLIPWIFLAILRSLVEDPPAPRAR